MSTGKAAIQGQQPSVKISPAQVQAIMGNPERTKYLKAWAVDDYRKYSPGEMCVQLFIDSAKPDKGASLTDWGCGTGRAGYKLWQHGMDVTLVDFAPNCLDDWIQARVGEDRLKFIEHDLTKDIDLRSDYGICADVMEHVPLDQVDRVMTTVLENSLHVLFQISTVPDHFGHHKDIGAPLHVTVRPYNWWLKKFADFGCIVHHSNELDNSCIFYVTGHHQFRFNRLVINTDDEQILANLKANGKLGLPQCRPHEAQDVEAMLLCGGPSLNDYTDEIIANREAGMKLITTNGSYHWAIDQGLKPSLQCVIDARPFNRRFVEPAVDGCQYLLASQCHPDTVAASPEGRTLMWQVTLEDRFLDQVRESFGEMYKDWFPCPGGSTVAYRTLCALNMLGIRKIHVYGLDSCLREDEHHAYAQEENDKSHVMDLRVGKGTEWDRTFKVHPWMATQAKEWLNLVGQHFQNMQLDIKGDGLIAHLTNSNAELFLQED